MQWTSRNPPPDTLTGAGDAQCTTINPPPGTLGQEMQVQKSTTRRSAHKCTTRYTAHPEIHCKIQWIWVPSRCCSRNPQPADALPIQKFTPFSPLSPSRWCCGLGYEFLHARHLDAHPEIHYQMHLDEHPEIHYQMHLDAVQFFVPVSFTRSSHWNYLEMTRKKLLIIKISNFLGFVKDDGICSSEVQK